MMSNFYNFWFLSQNFKNKFRFSVKSRPWSCFLNSLTTDPDQDTDLRIDLIWWIDRSLAQPVTVIDQQILILPAVYRSAVWCCSTNPGSAWKESPARRRHLDPSPWRHRAAEAEQTSLWGGETSSTAEVELLVAALIPPPLPPPSSPLCQYSLAPLVSFLSLLHHRNFQGFLQVMSPAPSFLLLKMM